MQDPLATNHTLVRYCQIELTANRLTFTERGRFLSFSAALLVDDCVYSTAKLLRISWGYSEMNRKLVGALLLVLASGGCCACDNCCDYLPPVLDGPYSSQGMRSGSAMAGEYVTPMSDENEAVTPLAMPE